MVCIVFTKTAVEDNILQDLAGNEQQHNTPQYYFRHFHKAISFQYSGISFYFQIILLIGVPNASDYHVINFQFFCANVVQILDFKDLIAWIA
jgi:hypothetical protein